MPVQLVVGAKGLARGIVERKVRATGERDELPLDASSRRSRTERRDDACRCSPPLEPMLAKLTRELPPAGEVLVRAEVGRLPLHRVPRRRRPRSAEPQQQAAAALLPRAARAAARAAARPRRARRRARHRERPTGLDFDALQLRQHPGRVARRRSSPRRSRRRTSRSTCSRSATSRCCDAPFRDRRAAARADARRRRRHRSTSRPRRSTATPRPTGSTRSRAPGFDGVVAKPLDGTYQPGERTMLKVKHERTCRLRRRRLPHPQGRQGRRLAAARPLRRRRRAAPRRRRERHGRAAAQASCSPTSSRCARTRSTIIRGASGPTR